MEKVDFLVVGQGIAGSILTHELLKAGKSVKVIDEHTEFTSSQKAAGIYNPITGRKMVKTWKADQLFSGLESYYRELEESYQAKFLHPKTIYRPFHSPEEINDWHGKLVDDDFSSFVAEVKTSSMVIQGINDPYGGLVLKNSGFVDLPVFLKAFSDFLIQKNILEEDHFECDELKLDEGEIAYRDIHADQLIFCEGPDVRDNPFWNHLPFKPVKGEIIDIKADLPTNMIINRGVFMLPKGSVFRVGSTYDHDQLDYIPTENGIKLLRNRLSKLYSGKYEVVGESAGIRPATFDRKPFIGKHPKYQRIGIFNGFGTKGVSLVPYFGRQFVNCLIHNGPLDPEVDIRRLNT